MKLSREVENPRKFPFLLKKWNESVMLSVPYNPS